MGHEPRRASGAEGEGRRFQGRNPVQFYRQKFRGLVFREVLVSSLKGELQGRRKFEFEAEYCWFESGQIVILQAQLIEDIRTTLSQRRSVVWCGSVVFFV